MTAGAAIKEVFTGFRSLLVGMRITLHQFFRPHITVQYPRETLKMPERFRGPIELILDPETGKSRCTACKLCERACPSDCIFVEGAKLEGQKTKSVTDYHLNFTTCSLCGLCVEACPFDAIQFSKVYNAVSLTREPFSDMDLVRHLAARQAVWTRNRLSAPRNLKSEISDLRSGISDSAPPPAEGKPS